MKIDLEKLMTVAEARDAIGCSPRAIWRAIQRAGRDGVVVEVLGRTMVRKDRLEVIRQHYYPYYSEAHQAQVKEWGRKGGSAKAANARAAKRPD